MTEAADNRTEMAEAASSPEGPMTEVTQTCPEAAESDAISRQHCAVFLRDDHVAVKDLGSRNGTFLNGEALTQEERLATGDELRVGPLQFEVIVTDDQGVVKEPPGPDPDTMNNQF